ncbi:hypothetical protein SBA1_60008 [Candidatus Sulfotelmatobacter kueseliae]|uniref:Uncharacterized protein n=1 Tax=Candidatus Sulfotelmatobacter kueseliae TaxID=2042962 RepID=A0A2U3L0I7_9BACT|nr:hypothetical protein SBA1_60008 [Candidatus Sulfotelmatobacter kueseliae]
MTKEPLLPPIRSGALQLLADEPPYRHTRAAGGIPQPVQEFLRKTDCKCVTHITQL